MPTKREELRALLDARPFRPFTVHMPDGRFLAVPAADFMGVHPRRPWAYIWNLENAGHALVNIDQIVRLEFDPPEPDDGDGNRGTGSTGSPVPATA